MPQSPPEMHPLISLRIFLIGFPRFGFVDTTRLHQVRTAGAVMIAI